jgi:hypothetical protein
VEPSARREAPLVWRTVRSMLSEGEWCYGGGGNANGLGEVAAKWFMDVLSSR